MCQHKDAIFMGGCIYIYCTEISNEIVEEDFILLENVKCIPYRFTNFNISFKRLSKYLGTDGAILKL